MHEPDPDAAFVSGVAKGNPVGLRAAEMRWEDLMAAMEIFGLPIALSFGAEMKP